MDKQISDLKAQIDKLQDENSNLTGRVDNLERDYKCREALCLFSSMA